jgi:hypothetical protein
MLKATIMITGDTARSDKGYISLSSAPVSCFWIDPKDDHGEIVVDTDFEGPAILTDKAVMYSPIKKILYDPACQDALQHAGHSPQSVFVDYFSLAFTQWSIERKADLEAWSQAAAESVKVHGESNVDMCFCVATPAGRYMFWFEFPFLLGAQCVFAFSRPSAAAIATLRGPHPCAS